MFVQNVFVFFLFVTVEKINLINYDGVGVFFSLTLFSLSLAISIRIECITRSFRKGRLMLLFKFLEPKIFKIYDTNGQDGPDTTYHRISAYLDFPLNTSIVAIISFNVES